MILGRCVHRRSAAVRLHDVASRRIAALAGEADTVDVPGWSRRSSVNPAAGLDPHYSVLLSTGSQRYGIPVLNGAS